MCSVGDRYALEHDGVFRQPLARITIERQAGTGGCVVHAAYERVQARRRILVNGYELLVDNDFVLNPAGSQPPSAAGGSVSLSPNVPPSSTT